MTSRKSRCSSFMGRENMEDYNADFLCMLETWHAGVEFSRSAARVLMRASIRSEHFFVATVYQNGGFFRDSVGA